MARTRIKSVFDDFFLRISRYTDLLLKISVAKRVEIPKEYEGDILKEVLESEKKRIHEAFVLNIYVTWELLAESVLIDCLSRDSSQYARHKDITLPKTPSRTLCRGLISGVGYFDFRDTGELKGIAKKILVPKFNPFSTIPADAGKKINEFCLIRNYLAHRSEDSKRALRGMYEKRYNTGFCEPGDFFFEYDAGEKQIRFASYTNAFIYAAEQMAEFLGV